MFECSIFVSRKYAIIQTRSTLFGEFLRYTDTYNTITSGQASTLLETTTHHC
jgi:hypothetical protein